MLKAIPSISIPMMTIPWSMPLNDKAYGELRYLLGGFLPQAVDPTHMYLLHTEGKPGSVGFLCTVPVVLCMISDKIET